MNKVVLLGFLSQDPTAKEFPEKNLVMSKFSVGVTDLRNYNQSYFFNCIAWNQTAEYINANLHKGDFVSIDGRLTNRSYINETGSKSYITEVVVESIKNYGSRKPKTEKVEEVNIDNFIQQQTANDSQIISDDTNKEDSLDVEWEDDL